MDICFYFLILEGRKYFPKPWESSLSHFPIRPMCPNPPQLTVLSFFQHLRLKNSSQYCIYLLILYIKSNYGILFVFSSVHATLYVTMSVRWLVGRLVGRSVRFWAFRAKRKDFSYCPCPATILPLPTRMWLMLPCIQPCFSLNTLLLDQNYWLRNKKYKR